MKSLPGILILTLSLLFFSFDAHTTGKDDYSALRNYYFLSPDGDDENPGTSLRPWKTLYKANQTLRPGDIAIFRDGVYNGIISPLHSGTNKEEPIIYRSESPLGAVLAGMEGSRFIINLKDKHHITIDGFMMRPESGGFGMIENCTHIILENSHMEESTLGYIQLQFIDSHYNRLMYNNMIRLLTRSADSKITGDGCRFFHSTHNVIEGNSFSKIGHSPLNFYSASPELCSHNIIRGNIFHNGWGRNFEFFNPDRVLFENNIINDAFNGAKSASSEIQPFFYNSIFRNNLVYDNWDNVFVTNSWDADLRYFGLDEGTVTLEFVDSRIYNNTFANNPIHVWRFGTNKPDPLIRSNKFLNNLFYRNGFTGDFSALILGSGFTSDNLFFNNLFFGEKPNQANLQIKDTRYTVESLGRDLSGQFVDNIDSDPLFYDFQNRYFMLSEGSPAINSGRPLTVAISSGSGKELYVDDARFFFDGFGIDGEVGDMIAVGRAGNLARVLKSDIERNLLILDRDISWTGGDPVSLPYAGTSPDIGALQYGNTGVFSVVPRAQPVSATPEREVVFSASISGEKGEVDMEWNFGDGTISKEAAPRHVYNDVGDYVVRLKSTDSSGEVSRSIFLVRVEPEADPTRPLVETDFEEENFELWGHIWDRGPSRQPFTYYPEIRDDGKGQCMCVSTEGNNRTLATNIKLRHWEIDKYPFVQFSYRIPPGVPVGVWLRPWPAEGRPERVCLGGSSANSSGQYINLEKYNLIDDGKWHDIVIDAREIRNVVPGIDHIYSFEFITYGETTEGQKLWFDDFAIRPFSTVSINEPDFSEKGLLINPNPVSNLLYIEFINSYIGPVLFDIIDLAGKVIYTFQYNKSNDKFNTFISVGMLPPDFYLIRITSGKVINVKRFIKV